MKIRTRLVTTDAKDLLRGSVVGVGTVGGCTELVTWFGGWTFGACTGTATGAPGLGLYCRAAAVAPAGEGAAPGTTTELAPGTAAVPRKVDMGGNDAADVTAEPRIGWAWASPFGDIDEYACKKENE